MSHRPRPAFLIVLLIPVIAAAVVASFLLGRSMMDDDPSPTATVETTPESTAISNLASPETTDATPEPPPAESTSGSLTDLMQYAPDRLSDGSLPLPEVATYSDIDTWLASQGLPTGSLTEAQAASLALPSILVSQGLDPIWEATFGFSLADVDQVLAVGQAPDYIMIFRGQFDSDVLTAAWTTGGYQAVAVDGTTVWSVYPFFTDTIDMSRKASQTAMGNMNNLVLLGDGTLIASAKLPRIKDVLEVVRGDAPSMAENGDISRLLALETPERGFVSAVIAKGELLESAPTDTRSIVLPDVVTGHDAMTVATPDAENMPKAKMCLFGLMLDRTTSTSATPEATPEIAEPPQLTIALVLTDDSMIADAAEVITSRFNREISASTNQTYASSWTLSIDNQPGSSDVLVLQIAPNQGTLGWIELIDSRDFGFLTWSDEAES